jgi:hypothetical protein
MGVQAAIMGASAINGAIQGRKSAKERRASIEQDRADRMEGYNFSKPYIQRSYDRAEDALNSSLEKGAYKGQTYADQNPYFSAGNHYMGGMGAMGAQGAFDINQAGKGFANNYNDLYNQTQGDRIQNAQDYAIANSGGLVNAAMRDDKRNLEENTLTGINMGASGSGNMNSSRAGIAEAVANRGFDDRKADMTANINDRLMDRSMNAQNQQFQDAMMANQGVSNSYFGGIGAMRDMGGFMTGAGNNLMGYQQGYLDDQRNRFEDDRDFALNQNINYQRGILNNAVYNTTPGNTPEKPNTVMSTLGGLQAGFGMGAKLGGMLPSKASTPSGGHWADDASNYNFRPSDFGGT